MSKIMNLSLFCMLVLCFGQYKDPINDPKFAIGLTGGVNYAIYVDKWDGWSKHTVSAPRANVGIHLHNKLSSRLNNMFEFSYLRLFYDVQDFGYIWDSVTYSEHYAFDNLHAASEIDFIFLKKGFFSSNLGVGFSLIWPFKGIREEYHSEQLTNRYLLSYSGVSWRKALFLLGSLNFEFDNLPVNNSLLYFRMDAQYPIAKSSTVGICQPGHSIPLRFNIGLLFKL